MKQVKCKKQFGVWYYETIKPSCWNDLDYPIYRLFNQEEQYINDFGSYGDMKIYIETGEII